MEIMTPSDPYLPIIVIGLIALIVFLGGRPRTETESTDGPPSGAELIERLQRTLGIAIVVESVELAESNEASDAIEPSDAIEAAYRSRSATTATIRASFMSGRHTTTVGVTGPTESDAWAALARAAIAWRNSDFQHIPIWPAGG